MRFFPLPAPTWIALALQAVSVAGLPGYDRLAGERPELQMKLDVLPRCSPADGPEEIVVCGLRRNSQRLQELDARFERTRLPDGRFSRELSETSTLEGGGPKGSVGISVPIKF